MKNVTGWQGFFIVVGVIAVIFMILNWNKIFGGSTGAKKDGMACTDSNGNASTYLNGVCVEVGRPNGGSGASSI